MAQVQDRARISRRTLFNQVVEFEQQGRIEESAQIRAELKELETRAKEAEGQLEPCFQEQE